MFTFTPLFVLVAIAVFAGYIVWAAAKSRVRLRNLAAATPKIHMWDDRLYSLLPPLVVGTIDASVDRNRTHEVVMEVLRRTQRTLIEHALDGRIDEVDENWVLDRAAENLLRVWPGSGA